jgi:osmoprotectant transport system substrate-binding protein
MNNQIRRPIVAVAALALAVAGACGSKSSSSSGSKAKGTLTIGAFGFSESELLADIYAGALRAKGFTVTVRAKLGTREIVIPALQRGDIDAVPEYLGNSLAVLNPTASAPGDDVTGTLTKLRAYFTPKGITVLEPSAATDGDSTGVTKATAQKYSLKKMSDLAAVASQLVLGGPPECVTRITCKLGLEQVYGAHFKDFKSLDAGGPLTKAALDNGDIQVARLFSSDSSLPEKGYVILEDDKHIQPVGNIVPVVRTGKVSATVESVFNAVSKKLTTGQLIELNKRTDIDKADPADAAADWLKEYGFNK